MNTYTHVYFFPSMWGTGLHFFVQIRCAITSSISHQVPLALSQFQAEVHLHQQLPKERAPLGFGLCKCPWSQHSGASSHSKGCSKVSFGMCFHGIVGWCVGLTKESISQWCFGKGKVACTTLSSFSSLQKHYLWEGCSSDIWRKFTLPIPGMLGINADYVCIYTCV